MGWSKRQLLPELVEKLPKNGKPIMSLLLVVEHY